MRFPRRRTLRLVILCLIVSSFATLRLRERDHVLRRLSWLTGCVALGTIRGVGMFAAHVSMQP